MTPPDYVDAVGQDVSYRADMQIDENKFVITPMNQNASLFDSSYLLKDATLPRYPDHDPESNEEGL